MIGDMSMFNEEIKKMLFLVEKNVHIYVQKTSAHNNGSRIESCSHGFPMSKHKTQRGKSSP